MQDTTSVIFDLGGVVVRWQPEALLEALYPDRATRAQVRSGLLRHADWHELDRGTLTREAALAGAAKRTGLPEPTFARFLDAVPGGLAIVPDTVDLLHRVKRTGRRLYCLSNMHHAFIDHLEDAYDFWDVFDGVVISCRVQMVKPEPEIYRHLLSRYRLVPEETVFVDDAPENVEVARREGLQGVLFEDASQCANELGLPAAD